MLQTAPRRRLKQFTEVTGSIALDRQIRRLAESLNLAEARNPTVELNYFTLSIPMVLSQEEKEERIAELADTVTAIKNSDVTLLGIWVSPTE
jgi:DNA-binding transcriptional regulator LsrR (DeoR family)